jgi:hypothetical protein
MSHNPPKGPTIARTTYKKPKRMADAELAELFNRKKNAQSDLQTPGAKAKKAAFEKKPSTKVN